MFEPNSRYVKIQTVDTESATGTKGKVVKLRRLPYVPGSLTEVKGTDRLDIMAQRKFADGTKFWHIADANTEIEANDLVREERAENPLVSVKIRHIDVPKN
jgi:hypothetical protein